MFKFNVKQQKNQFEFEYQTFRKIYEWYVCSKYECDTTQWLADYTVFKGVGIVLFEISIKWQSSYKNLVSVQEKEIVWFQNIQRWKFKSEFDTYYCEREYVLCMWLRKK